VTSDINYLRTFGYDVHNLSNLQEIVDTASMWRYVKRDTNPRNLGSILAELDILGWNLHNAGNDAAYTLQAMIKIAVRDLKERQKFKDIKEKEMKERVAE
jgi:DNA polymerase III alpha subunit (gram-positive type)